MLAGETAVALLHRALGGGRPQLRTPENEQREHDRLVLAYLLWEFRDMLHYLPRRIAQEVGKLLAGKDE